MLKKNRICKNKICQGPVSFFDGNMVVSAGMAHITFCDAGDVVTQASSVSSSGSDDDTEQRPMFGSGVADDYVKRNSNVPEYSSVAEKLMVCH